MKQVWIALGGTGAKLLTTAVLGASADLLTDRQLKPAERVRLWLVDTDTDNGNAEEASRAVEAYETVRGLYAHSDWERRGFHTELTLSRWTPEDPEGDSLGRMAADTAEDALLADCILAEDARSAAEGTHGDAGAAALLFSDALHGETQQTGWQGIRNSIRVELASGGVQVIFLGSAWGGTASAGIPAMAKELRKSFAGAGNPLSIGALLTLPDMAKTGEALLEPGAVDARAKAGLEALCGEGLLDAAWVLGLPRSAYAAPEQTAAGGKNQRNPARVTELAALACMMDILRTDPEKQPAGGLRTFAKTREGFGWEAFGDYAEPIRDRLGRLYKTAALWLSGLGDGIADACENADAKQIRQVNYLAAYFHDLPGAMEDERRRLASSARAVTELMRIAAVWVGEVLQTMPTALRSGDALTVASIRAGKAYRTLLDAVGEVSLLEDEINRSGMKGESYVSRGKPKETDTDRLIREAEEKHGAVARLEAEQQRLDQMIGGERTLALRRQMLDGIRRAENEEKRRVERERAALTSAGHEASELLEERRSAFFRLETHMRSLGFEAAYAEEAIRKAEEARIEDQPPMLDDSGAEGGLFSHSLAMTLDAVAAGGSEQPRNEERAAVQREWDQLLLGTPEDTVTASEVLAGLGAGRGCSRQEALPALLARLMAWSVREDRK